MDLIEQESFRNLLTVVLGIVMVLSCLLYLASKSKYPNLWGIGYWLAIAGGLFTSSTAIVFKFSGHLDSAYNVLPLFVTNVIAVKSYMAVYESRKKKAQPESDVQT